MNSIPQTGPDAVDVHVGNKLRTMRREKGISQQGLAEACGVTFQQVQKYERAANRISCSMLVRAARALNVAPSYFLDDAPGAPDSLPMSDDWSVAARIVSSVPGASDALRALDAMPGWARTHLVATLQLAAGQHVSAPASASVAA